MAEVKFNGGRPVVLCGKCRVIVRHVRQGEDIDLLCYTEAEYCSKCSQLPKSEQLKKLPK